MKLVLLRTGLAACALSVPAMPTLAAQASDVPDRITQHVVVSFAGIDPATAAGRRQVEHRLRAAAARACRPPAILPAEIWDRVGCYRKALAEARQVAAARLGDPQLARR